MLFGIDISPRYLRGRIEALRHMYSKYMKENDEKGRRYLRMGTDLYKPDELELYTAMFAKNFDNSPLSFVELTQFNTWFKLHPEKVAGTEKLTTSLHFPVTIKGNREDVERVLSFKKSKPASKDIALAEAEAEAELLLLELMDMDNIEGVQTEILTVKNEYQNVNKKDIPKKTQQYYMKNIQKHKVTNLDQNIEIIFIKSGKFKTTRGRHEKGILKPIDSTLATAINHIKELLKSGVFCGTSTTLKQNHIKMGGVKWWYFYSKIIIDGKLTILNIPVLQVKKGNNEYKFQYSLDYADIKKVLAGKRTFK